MRHLGTTTTSALTIPTPCWWRLPKHLRDAVNSGYRVRVRNPRIHREALADALAWYRDNPAATP